MVLTLFCASVFIVSAVFCVMSSQKLLERTRNTDAAVEKLWEKVDKNTQEIATLKERVKNLKEDFDAVIIDVGRNNDNISELWGRLDAKKDSGSVASRGNSK